VHSHDWVCLTLVYTHGLRIVVLNVVVILNQCTILLYKIGNGSLIILEGSSKTDKGTEIT
jgi:hypothetical protein